MENGRGEAEEGYDRAKEVKQFDDSKIGVKGLIDSGITSIPRFFVHPPHSLPATATTNPPPPPGSNLIPNIDLSGFDSDRRSIIVDQIRDAASSLGFFQVTNHGIPSQVLDRTVAAIKAFNEQPTEIKAIHYSREMGRSVSFFSNFDIYRSKAATWRDTITLRWGPNLEIGEIPEICRSEFVEWDRQVQRLGETLMELLSEGLGVERGKLKALTCNEGKTMVAHYYPFCPQPDLTLGIDSHTDPAALTVLLQDQIGGLQVKKGEHWVDVQPVRDALVINIGDLLQIISNDGYSSVEHRVLANHLHQPRISIATFFNPSKREDFHGPLPELISLDKPPLYRSFTLAEFFTRFFTKELGSKSQISYFQL
ncbi:1-aminocyclopropane-1-carboxylate oxidase homolog 4-like [Macadamia integrifolia]|uniref:1-aminocyclopropane-1-carboxylate oxidase homolog 4-like n=1 Tax=Macadamia integrifolia TaxID=60698 RepID=UPI001C50070D|nr:1-aminocyclopropane-1-carboxylate oxidase homolog 4-like [Macadamia integrifolia]